MATWPHGDTDTSVDRRVLQDFLILFLFLGGARKIYTAYGETRISPPAKQAILIVVRSRIRYTVLRLETAY